MKTTKAILYFMVASTMALGTACSSTNTDATGTSTAGSSAGTGAGMNGSTSAAGSDISGAGTANTGASGTGATGSGAGGTATGTGAASTATGTASDVTAFMGTFATMEDPVFLMNAASSNLLEIQAGQVASQKATNPEVKKFAQMMVDHHTMATQQLKSVATPLGVQMPTAMMPVHQAMADQLTNKTGKNFDEAYMDMMETAHKMDIAMFEVKSKASDTPSVQAFATKTLPMLRSHHKMADELEEKVD